MASDPARLNSELIEHVSETMGMRLPDRVAEAFRAVPRHLFLPGIPLEQAYDDVAIVIKVERGEPRSSSSQPTIMAIMLAQLDVREGDRVLEIGTGSGFNAALLAELAGPRGRVVTIDLDGAIATGARARLAAAGATRVEVVEGDGADGFPDGAPYERMIVTAAVWDVPNAWHTQLAPGGRIVMPLIVHGAQVCVALDRVGDGLESTAICECGFMRLRGASGLQAAPLRLGPRDGLFVEFPAREQPPAPPERIYAWLTGGWLETRTAVTVDHVGELFRASQWIAMRDPDCCRLSAYGDDAEHELLPQLPAPVGSARGSVASGVADERGLAVIALPDPRADEPSTLFVRRYGDARAAAQRLEEQLEAWAAAGRGTALPRRIRILPRGAPAPAGASTTARGDSVVVVEQ